METDTTLVRTDGTVILNTEATVYLHLSRIVHPRHTEHNDTLWFHNPLQDGVGFQLRHFFYHWLQGLQHLLNSLQILTFVAILCLNLLPNSLYVSVLHSHYPQRTVKIFYLNFSKDPVILPQKSHFLQYK